MFCSNLNAGVRNVLRTVTPTIEHYTEVALSLTGIVRNALSSKLAEGITNAIPGDWDDNLKDKITSAANKANEELGLFEKELESTGDVVEALHNRLNALPEKAQNMNLIKFAQRILAWLDGNEQSESVYDTIAQAAILNK